MDSIEESHNICSQNQLYNNNNNNNNHTNNNNNNNHDNNNTTNNNTLHHNNNISNSSTVNNITSTISNNNNNHIPTNSDQDSHFHNSFRQKFQIGTRIIKKYSGVPYEGKVVGFNGTHYQIFYPVDKDTEDMTASEVGLALRNKVIGSRRRTNHRTQSTRTQQTDLHGNRIEGNDSETYGHTYPKEAQLNHTIITYQNIGEQTRSSLTTRSKDTTTAFKESKAAIALYTETWLNEPKLDVYDRFNERTKKYAPHSYSRHSHNEHVLESETWRVAGGTALTVDASFKSHKSPQQGEGKDREGLGRWTWIRLRGKDNIHTRFISAYRPCKNRGTSTVWTQHRNYFRELGHTDPDPLQFFDNQLCHSIEQWMEMGDNIVLGIDMNEDARTGSLALQLKALNLRDAILQRHGSDSAPATFEANQSRTPIDAIWVSAQVTTYRSGYMPFGADSPAAPSDGHRMLWIEVDNLSILGKDIPHSLQSLKHAKVNSLHPGQRRLFNKKLKQRYRANNAYEVIPQITAEDEAHNSPTNKDRQASLRKLTLTMHKLHRRTRHAKAENTSNFRKSKAGADDWSPPYRQLKRQIDLWKRVRKLKTRRLTSKWQIKTLARKVGIKWSTILSLSLQEVKDNLRQSFANLRKNKSKFPEWRMSFLTSLHQSIADDTGIEAHVVARRLRREQKSREQGRRSRRITGKNIKEPVLRATVITAEGIIKEYNTQTEMVPIIAESNRERQDQSKDTPFMTMPLLADFGFLATEENAYKVINGHYIPPNGTNPYAVKFLQECEMTQAIRNHGSVDLLVTPVQNKEGWHKMKDRTASAHGPFNLGFSTYRTTSTDPSLNRIDALLRNIPVKNGIIPEYWKNITDCMILKRSGIHTINKMRTIQLMDPEYNNINKLAGKRIMEVAEKYNLLAKDQYGSRKRHKSSNCCLNKVCLMDILRQKKHAGAISMNDLKGCYDRVVHTVAILVLLAFGLNYTAAKLMMEVLQVAEHSIKTGFGVSQPAYGGREEVPEQGLGQGNGCAPALWCLISSIMIKVMQRLGHHVEMSSSISLTLLSIVCFAFVDDTDLPVIATHRSDSGEIVAKKFQRALTDWAGVVAVTGGELEPAKSWSYLIDFEWIDNKWRYRTKDMMEATFTMNDKYGNPHPLQRLDVTEGKETLGVHISMDGNARDQYKYLKKECRIFGDKMRATDCTPYDAVKTYTTCLMPKLEYCMPITSFSKKQWTSIIWPALRPTLNKAHIAISDPRAVLYGSQKYFGYVLEDPYLRQGITKLITLVQEAMNESLTGNIITHAIEGYKLELGFSTTPANTPWEEVKEYSTNCWYKHLVEWIQDTNKYRQLIEVVDNVPCLLKLRLNDTFLMQAFIEAKIDSTELELINIIRMSIQAVTITDIATADGRKITHNAWHALSSNHLRTGLDWPRAPARFTKTQIEVWQRALKHTFLTRYANSAARTLHFDFQVHGWEDPTYLHKWKYFYSPSDRRLYQRAGIGWKPYRSVQGNLRGQKFLPTEPTLAREKPATACHIATIRRVNALIIIESVVPIAIAATLGRQQKPGHPILRDPVDIEEAFGPSLQYPSVLIDSITLPSDACLAIATAIKNGTACAISDGSYEDDPQQGSSGFIITPGKTRQNMLTGRNLIPGSAEDQSAYRSELGGVTGVLAAVSVIVHYYDIKQGTLELALDGRSAKNESASTDFLLAGQSSFDILQDIHHRLDLLPITVKFRWVEGHQREKGKTLDWWGKQNDLVDDIAKKFLKQNASTWQYKLTRLWYEKWTVLINRKKQTRLDHRNLYEALVEPIITDYWRTHHDIPITDPSKIDWTASYTAVKGLPVHKQRFIPRFNAGHCGNNHIQWRRKEREDPSCKSCPDGPKEKTSHILHCSNPKAKSHFLKKVKNDIIPHCVNSKTFPPLIESIKNILTLWRNGRHIPTSSFPTAHGIREAVEEQAEIGWDNFMLGRWSKKWQIIQKNHLNSIGSKRSPRRWTAAVIRQFMLTCWDIWDFRNTLIHGKGGRLARLQNRLLDTRIRQEFEIGTNELLPIDYYLITMHSMRRILDDTLLKKELWLRCIGISRKAAANIPIVRNGLIQSTLDDYICSEIQAFNGGFIASNEN